MKAKGIKRSSLIAAIVLISTICYSQTTVTSGNWTDPTVWSGGAVPAASGTVTVSNPLTIDTNLSPTGTWTFSSNTTDPPGGTAYTFNPAAGTNTITISTGYRVTFEGGSSGTPNAFNSGTIDIYGTLVLGYTQLNNSANLNINVKAGGTLIIYGDLTNKNNSGTLVVAGSIIIYGSYLGTTGSTSVSGAGTLTTTGVLTTAGGSTVFGSTNNCNLGPCSGTTLSCTFDNYISPSVATVCSGTSVVTFTSNPVTSNPPAGPTYQWKSSTDNITFTNVGTNSASYTTPILTQTTYVKVQITSTTPCTSTSAASVASVISSSGGWLGTTNNWGTASNWCSNAVPTSSTDVTITNGTGINNMPTVASGTAATCKNLIISSTFPASSITLANASDASLSIFGNFTNDGTFTDNTTSSSAGIKFVGSTAQTIAGITANNFNNLTIANTSGITPAIDITTNNVTVNSNLTMTSGVTNLNGYTITLGTAAASAGTIAYTTGTRFYGGNIERWVPTSSITIGNVAGQFPIGTSTDYRPIFFGNAGLTAGGTIKVRHTGSVSSTAVAPTFADNGGTVAIRSNSFWTVTTGNSIGTGTHGLSTQGTGFGTVGALSDLRITLVNTIAPGSDGIHTNGTLTNPEVNRIGLTTANLSNSFYWGSINALQTPLPISLISFIGQQAVNVIRLNWKTASELNFDFFSLEKSKDGKSFFEIGKLKGNGTTVSEHAYQFLDEKPLIGKNYYRLKSVDFDGYTEYSNVISIDFLNEKQFSVFPNPTLGKSIWMKINFTADQEYYVTVFDNFGMLIGRYSSTKQEEELTFKEDLPQGIYYAQFSSVGFTKTVRFVVVK